MPEYSYDDVVSMLYERCAYLYNVPLEEFFTGMLNKRVGQALLKSVGISPLSRLAATLSEAEIQKLAGTIKSWKFKITGTMSWNNAQVTRGGALTAEFDPVTMESKLIKGLFACGEVLDIDGDCGGYNLQWAWSSGHLAGTYAKKERKNEKFN
ncbi:MAG: NAD(P)/FAD-dependent oxidoreductase, partial [Candidatus Ornithomonoglobus sp.]